VFPGVQGPGCVLRWWIEVEQGWRYLEVPRREAHRGVFSKVSYQLKQACTSILAPSQSTAAPLLESRSTKNWLFVLYARLPLPALIATPPFYSLAAVASALLCICCACIALHCVSLLVHRQCHSPALIAPTRQYHDGEASSSLSTLSQSDPDPAVRLTGTKRNKTGTGAASASIVQVCDETAPYLMHLDTSPLISNYTYQYSYSHSATTTITIIDLAKSTPQWRPHRPSP
jgi:hypothetical protein